MALDSAWSGSLVVLIVYSISNVNFIHCISNSGDGLSMPPKISVIIPTRDRPSIKSTLLSLVAQTIRDFEVVVVDDGSKVMHVTGADFEGIPQHTLIMRTSSGGAAVARNTGVEFAQGEYIAFLDDDCEAKPDWLQEFLNYAQANMDSSVCAFGGKVFPPKNASILQRAIYYLPMNDENTLKVERAGKPILVDHVSCTNSFWYASKFKGLWFDTSLTRSQDLEICLRAKGKFYTIPGATVYHNYRSSFKTFIKQSYIQGLGGGLLLKKHPKYFGLKRIIIYIFPAFLLLSLFLPIILILPLLLCRSQVSAFAREKNILVSGLAWILEYIKYYFNLFGIWRNILRWKS